MSMKNLPVAPMGRPSASLRSEILPRALGRWSPEVRAADRDEERSISIYDAIGYDPGRARASQPSALLAHCAAWAKAR